MVIMRGAYVHASMCACNYVCVCVCVCVCICVYVCICDDVYVCLCAYVGTCVRMHAYVCNVSLRRHAQHSPWKWLAAMLSQLRSCMERARGSSPRR